jgi:hypothetical protein
MFRRIAISILSIVVLSAFGAAQSLADAAREARKNKRTSSPSKGVYTNESLSPGTSSASTTAGASTTTTEAEPSSEKKASSSENAKSGEGDAASEDEKKKATDELRTKLAEAQKELTQVQRELDLMQRENRMRTAQFYADAGARLRDEKKYADEDRQNQASLAAKQKAVADAQKIVNDLQEQMRRLGVR